jgi:hypothetical protein
MFMPPAVIEGIVVKRPRRLNLRRSFVNGLVGWDLALHSTAWKDPDVSLVPLKLLAGKSTDFRRDAAGPGAAMVTCIDFLKLELSTPHQCNNFTL